MLHGSSGLELAYTLVLAGMIAALIRERAPLARALLSPVVAVVVLVLAGLASFFLALPFKLLSSLAGSLLGSLVSVLQVLCSGLLMTVSGYAAGRILATGELGSKERHRRGAVLLATAPAGAAAGRPPAPGTVTIGGIAIPREDEVLHFKLIGTTGTGKSTVIRELMDGALGRDDRAVFADPDGAYTLRYYDPARRDVILSPFWPGAHKWDLFAEVKAPQDIEQISRCLIAGSDSGDGRFWTDSARIFFGACVQHCISAGRDDQFLLQLLTNAPLEELRSALAGTLAASQVAEGNEKTFASIRSTAIASLTGFRHMIAQQGPPFSVRQWVRSGRGVLFLPYKAGEIASLRLLIATLLRLAIFEAMDAPEGDQRLWFVVDELDALGEIDGLQDALARLRKFGGRCVLGFQSITQVEKTYGKSAHAMVENCANTLILRCSASHRGGTSEYAAQLIGQREVTRPVASYRGWPGWLSRSVTMQTHVESAVLASEVERLPNLHGFLKIGSNPDWMRVQLTPAPVGAPAAAPGSAGGPHTGMPPPQVLSPPPSGAPARQPEPAAAGTAPAPGGSRGRRRSAPGPSGPAAEAPSATAVPTPAPGEAPEAVVRPAGGARTAAGPDAQREAGSR